MAEEVKQVLHVLNGLYQDGIISQADFYLARTTAQLFEKAEPALICAAANLSWAIERGSVCLDLEDQETLFGIPADHERLRVLPKRSAWKELLAQSPLVNQMDARGVSCPEEPFVIDRGFFFSTRLWHQEDVVHEWFRRRLDLGDSSEESPLISLIEEVFPRGDPSQKRAVLGVCTTNFSIITGGPGTGKTTTVMAALEVLEKQAGNRGVSCALVAPTGKAVARMQEAYLARKRARIKEDNSLVECQITTLHRLLGMTRGGAPRYHQQNKLKFDCIVIDESSMVDLELFYRLLLALPDKARVVFLGDRDQLSSVGAGSVFADLCHAGLFSPGQSKLRRRIHVLECGHRAQKKIGDFCRLVMDGQAEINFDDFGKDVRFIDSRTVAREELIKLCVAEYLEVMPKMPLGDDAHLADLSTYIGALRVLTPLRVGTWGSSALGVAVDKELSIRLNGVTRRSWFHGQQLIVNRNNYGMGVYNGDIGVVSGSSLDNNPQLLLPRGDEGQESKVRRFGLALLGDINGDYVESASVLTVHKSQGSEYAKVILILPPEVSPGLSRELIYTAITRARESLLIIGPKDVWNISLSRQVRRSSAFIKRLLNSEH